MDDEPRVHKKRQFYALDGRRLTVADLVEEGLLEPDCSIEIYRPRSGETFTGLVTKLGRIRLSDGQEFASPSKAANVALGGGSIDGWITWRVAETKATLDEHRQTLLNLNAEASGIAEADPASASEGVPRALRRHEWLREARSRADSGDPETLTVRDFLCWWGAKGRGSLVVSRVEADTENHGLITAPNFRKVGLDSFVRLERPPVEDNAAEPSEESPGQEQSGASEQLDVGLSVGTLSSALGGIVTISPAATIAEAVTLMSLDDFSQLAVMSGERTLRGAVTWASIAKARHVDPDAHLSAAIVRAREVRFDEELIDILGVLFDDDFVFVRDETNRVSGIVTTADVARAYGDLATPFFLIGQIDQTLRGLISQSVDFEVVLELCNPLGERKMTSFDDMSFGDYLRTLQNTGVWESVGWQLDRKVFVDRLEELKDLRNDVMHFNGDQIEDEKSAKMRHFLRALQEYCQ